MKNIKYIPFILAMTVTGVVSSCVSDKDFLVEKPKATLTITNAYDKSDQILNTLLTGYYEYEELFFPGLFGQGINYNVSAGTDMIDNKYQLGLSNHLSNFPASWSTTSSIPKSFWDKFYKIISYGNLSLSKIDEVTWADASEKTRVAAEAHFLRGISYLRLGELFGGVPLVLEYTETTNYGYNRASRTETYQAAIDDLLEAYGGLPSNVNAEYGRAGKGAAALYLAEAYLAMGVEANDNSSFAKAAQYAEEVTKLHPLMTDRFGARLPGVSGDTNGITNADLDGNVISDLFVDANVKSVANSEAVWVMVAAPNYQQYNLNGGRRGCTLGLTPALQDYTWAPEYAEDGAAAGPWKAFSKKYGGAMSPATHGGTGWAQVTPTWFASYTMWDEEHNGSKGDLRYVEDVTVKTEFMVCDENHSLYEKKAGWDQIDKHTPELAGIYFPIFYKETPFDAWDYDLTAPASWFGTYVYTYRSKYGARSAEAYLMLAEAKFRQGDNAGALDALNTVRQRAQAENLTNIDINVILDERARELLYEEFRWATFMRLKPSEWKDRIYKYGMYSARGNDPTYDTEYLGKKGNIRRWAEFTDQIGFDLMPIPQTYIDLNTESDGMPQNPGWKE